MITFVSRGKIKIVERKSSILSILRAAGCQPSITFHRPSGQTFLPSQGSCSEDSMIGCQDEWWWPILAIALDHKNQDVSRIWAIGNCKSSHIMLAPIHHQQVAVTVLGRGQPLSEYAQNCQRKTYRQKLCRPRLANIHCLWFTKSLKNCRRFTILHHTLFITLLS